jgi:hypothetical protein
MLVQLYVHLFDKKNSYPYSGRDVSKECFIGGKQLLNLPICDIILSRCKTNPLFYAGSKILVFEMDSTFR